MDTSLTIISLILVVCCFVPFLLLSQAGVKDKKKRQKQYKSIISKNKLDITEYELWGNSYIGVDSVHKKLLFIQLDHERPIKELLDLGSIKDCEVLTSVRNLGKKSDRKHILLRADLEISFLGKTPPMELNFYDFECIRREDFELNRVEKWKNTIEDQIQMKKMPVILGTE